MGFFDKLASTASSVIADGKADSLINMVGSKRTPSDKQEAADHAAQSAASLYSPELEEMISMIIEEGEVSDSDLKLITKRALKEGVDPDELEFNIRMRLKKASREREALKNINPVENLSGAFTLLEKYAKGGKQVVDAGALSAALSVIPGVGSVAAAGGLLSAFIETPSNLNQLKAEAIRKFILPDNAEYLTQFINYAASQQAECNLDKSAKMSLKGMISSIALGSDIDLDPIWDMKISEACDKAETFYIDDVQLAQAVKRHKPTLIKKLREGKMGPFSLNSPLESVAAPKDDEELLEVVEFAYAHKTSDDWEDWKGFHARMYREAEGRFAGNGAAMNKLSRYKIKKFGIF